MMTKKKVQNEIKRLEDSKGVTKLETIFLMMNRTRFLEGMKRACQGFWN